MEGRPAGSTGDVASTPAARRCENCGAPLRFDPGCGSLRCAHCRGTEEVAAATGDVPELDYATEVGAGASTADDREDVRLQCAECGAPSDFEPNTWAAACPYCRTPFVGNPTSTRSIRPGGLVPLAITEDQARANTRAWLGNRWFAPRHLDKAAVGALRAGYTPAWVFSMDTTASYRGRRGDNYLDTETYTTTDADGNRTTQTRTVTKIRWRSASGSVSLRFRDVTAFAGTDPLSRFGEDLEPWSVADAIPYADDHLRGTSARTYTKPPAAGLTRARERTTDAVEDAIKADIGGDHQEIHDVERRDHDVRLRYLLLPGWEATYQHRADTYQLAVNGRTGTVDGTRPYSKVKIAIAVGVALAIATVVVLLIVRSSSNPPSTPAPSPTTVVVPTAPTTTVPPPTTSPATTTATAPTTPTTSAAPDASAPGVTDATAANGFAPSRAVGNPRASRAPPVPLASGPQR